MFTFTTAGRLIGTASAAALLLLGPASGTAALGASVCTSIGDSKLRCTIKKISDCNAIEDYPYARNLFCPAAFSAARTMAAQLEQTLGGVVSTGGFFHYFQLEAPPDPQAQTTIACLDTPAPYPSGSRFIVGAGVPLCHLVAFATSPGPVEAGDDDDKDNPVPADVRAYPEYFSRLYTPGPPFQLTKFRPGSKFDGLVEELGAAGDDGFIKDYPRFSPTELYAPDHWLRDPRYKGISGGGGGGWGGEIAILAKDGTPLAQLAFGGGGGGGFTSSLGPSGTVPTSTLGAGGGGGMQFGNAYRFGQYNGLGLGAGVGSDETRVQYSYNDYLGSPQPPLPVHQYNPGVIAEYQRQLANLADLLRARFRDGKTIVLTGGGGMGAGTEYLMQNAQEFEPHALSTQAGFQFSFEYRRQRPAVSGVTGLLAEQEEFYKLLGDDYEKANHQAYEECGRDYANFKCMCPRAHAMVICLAGEQLGDPAKIPSWLQQQHCSNDSPPTGVNGLTSYQQSLVNVTSNPCTTVLRNYFTVLNVLVNDRD